MNIIDRISIGSTRDYSKFIYICFLPSTQPYLEAQQSLGHAQVGVSKAPAYLRGMLGAHAAQGIVLDDVNGAGAVAIAVDHRRRGNRR